VLNYVCIGSLWPVTFGLACCGGDDTRRYSIVFENHPDLCHILANYGFVGHYFCKGFSISGYVKMRYD